MNNIYGYIGTYASDNSKGIYAFTFDTQTGEVTKPELFSEVKNAKYLSLYENQLVSPMEEEQAGLCIQHIENHAPTMVKTLFHESKTACYVMQHNDMIYSANYHEGTVLIYKQNDGTYALVKKIDIAPKAGCHQVIVHNQYILVPSLLIDKLCIYDTTADYQLVKELDFPQGTGPRHGVFTADHTKFYLASELSNEVFVYQVDGLNFTLLTSIAVLPEGDHTNADGAAIRLSSDEKFLYVSTRGANLMSVISLDGTIEVIQHCSCGGDHPRDFIISPNEKFLLVVNRLSNNLVVFERNMSTGLLMETPYQLQVHDGVSVVLNDKEKGN